MKKQKVKSKRKNIYNANLNPKTLEQLNHKR